MNNSLAMTSAVAILMTASIQSNAQTQFIMPDRVKVADYKLSVAKDAAISVTVGGHEYRITSRFSTTAPEKWNLFGQPEQSNLVNWKLSIKRLSATEYRVSARDLNYTLTRTIKLKPDHVDVTDTFANTSASLIGIMFENNIKGDSANPVMRVCGLTDAVATGPNTRFKVAEDGSYIMGSPARPLVQLSQSNSSSLGMIAVDDVFRVQADMSRSRDGVSISDSNFGLAPKARYTVNWQLYPLEKDDHYAFMNRVRRVWKTNYLIDGPFGFFHMLRSGQQSDDKLRDMLKQTGMKMGCFVVASDRARMEAFGSAYLTEADTQKELVKKEMARARRLAPGLKVQVYHHGYLDNAKDVAEKFADCQILEQNGEQYSF